MQTVAISRQSFVEAVMKVQRIRRRVFSNRFNRAGKVAGRLGRAARTAGALAIVSTLALTLCPLPTDGRAQESRAQPPSQATSSRDDKKANSSGAAANVWVVSQDDYYIGT